MVSAYGIAHFLESADAVTLALAALLGLMSVASWYVIAGRAIENHVEHRAMREALGTWRRTGLASFEGQDQARSALGRMVVEGRAALSNHRASAAPGAEDPLSASEYLAQALDGALAAELSRRERGLTLLASVGSSAPFVGLFGTVWGVYGALVQIGLSGQGTLDKVAGPVGEALIMTAAGLGVAIPAVLAYNAFQRGNRISALNLERDAHRLLPQLLAAPLPLEGTAATGGR